MADTPKYVKFMRGTEALFNSLAIKDNDTLYFVYSEGQENRGKLYLGNRLISGSFSDGTAIINIGDIEDVYINTSELSDGDILVYDAIQHKWKNASLDDLIMIGATAENAGIAGLVPRPLAGDQNKFLRGDGTWVPVPGGMTEEERQSIQNLQSTVSALIGDHTGQFIDDIISDLLITSTAPESLDSLQEIAEWIQSHPEDAAAMNADISDLQDRMDALEDLNIGTFISTTTSSLTDLSGRVLALENTVGDLQEIQTNYVTIGDQLNNLTLLTTEMNDRLRWHELSE